MVVMLLEGSIFWQEVSTFFVISEALELVLVWCCESLDLSLAEDAENHKG